MLKHIAEEKTEILWNPETETTSSAEQDGGDTHKVLCQFLKNVLECPYFFLFQSLFVHFLSLSSLSTGSGVNTIVNCLVRN